MLKKRAAALLCLLFLLLGAACVSMGRASLGEEYLAAAGAQSLYRLDVYQGRGTIYDKDLSPLVGEETQYVAAAAATISAVGALERATGGRYRHQLALALENGQPFQLVIDQPVEDPLVDVFQVPRRYSQNQLAPHLIGYLDSAGGGAAGIELAMDDLLRRCGGKISVTYRVDAVGRAIAGEDRQVENTLSHTRGGVALTLDREAQALAQEAAQALGKGAVVVTEVPGCEIRALASVPDFSPVDFSGLGEEDAPLVNRAFAAFSPGSTFKVVAAAALLEAGMGDVTFTCQGSLNAGGLVFHCAGGAAHGELNLSGALARSCNCYFISAVRALGGQQVLSMAHNLGFGQAQEFGRGLWTSSGALPARADLENPRALANFSFGQGALTATPLQLCAMCNAVANGGVYRSPRLIAGQVDEDGQLSPLASAAERESRVMESVTAHRLRQALKEAARSGTGQAGAPAEGVAGIKTGTAQTGAFDEAGEELLHFWYCGFVEDETGPRWCVTVLKESAPGDGGVTAQTFRRVAEGLLSLAAEND